MNDKPPVTLTASSTVKHVRRIEPPHGARHPWVPTAKFNNTKIVGGIDRNGNRLPYAPELTSNAVLAI
ncbi:MAG: hypothetical protein WA146_01835 [Thiobacillus sp.]|nr:hypothetical protein [Thiobacillus sp.]MDO9386107.1 hypothetical protein [Thiobacillus sp.]